MSSSNTPKNKPLAGFAALKKVQKQVKAQAKKIAVENKLEKEKRSEVELASNVFKQHMEDVTPIKPSDRIFHEKPKPPPRPIKRLEDDKNVMLSSLSDAFDVETLLYTDEALSFKRTGVSLDTIRKLRRGYWYIQAEIDLHGYRQDEARETLNQFIHTASKQGFRCIKVIHGKGLGSPGKTPVLKARVLNWLVQKHEVLAYTQARGVDGGAGAVLVLLKSNRVNLQMLEKEE